MPPYSEKNHTCKFLIAPFTVCKDISLLYILQREAVFERQRELFDPFVKMLRTELF